jgi:hypothetical protein
MKNGHTFRYNFVRNDSYDPQEYILTWNNQKTMIIDDMDNRTKTYQHAQTFLDTTNHIQTHVSICTSSNNLININKHNNWSILEQLEQYPKTIQRVYQYQQVIIYHLPVIKSTYTTVNYTKCENDIIKLCEDLGHDMSGKTITDELRTIDCMLEIPDTRRVRNDRSSRNYMVKKRVGRIREKQLKRTKKNQFSNIITDN